MNDQNCWQQPVLVLAPVSKLCFWSWSWVVLTVAWTCVCLLVLYFCHCFLTFCPPGCLLIKTLFGSSGVPSPVNEAHKKLVSVRSSTSLVKSEMGLSSFLCQNSCQSKRILPFDLSSDYQAEGRDWGQPASPTLKCRASRGRTTSWHSFAGEGIDAGGLWEKIRKIYRISWLLM